MDNSQKTPLSRTLPTFVTRVAADQVAQRFVALPGTVAAVNANGTIVTIDFDVPGLNIQSVSMPVAVSKYARPPIAVGDTGRAVSSTAYIGSASGLGTGSPAASALQPNLSALVWEPISNAGWSGNPNNGVYTDATGASVLTLAETGITLAFGSHSVVINSSGVTIDGQVFLSHEHLPGTLTAPSGGGPVTGDTGAVT